MLILYASSKVSCTMKQQKINKKIEMQVTNDVKKNHKHQKQSNVHDNDLNLNIFCCHHCVIPKSIIIIII